MPPTATESTGMFDLIDLSEEINFQKYWQILKRRWLLIVLVAGGLFGLAAFYALKQPRIYQAQGKILFKPDETQSLVGLNTNNKEFGILQKLTEKSDPLSTQAEIIKSESIAQPVIKALNLKDKQGKPLDAKSLSDTLAVKPVVGTDILQVTYPNQDPKVAAATVNAVMKAYIANNIERSRRDAIAARKFIIEQLPSSERAVNQAEANLRQFKEANGVVALEQETTASVEGISTLDQQITQTQADFRQAVARVTELQSQVGMQASTALVFNSLNQSEGVQKALSEWQQAQALLAKQQTLYRGLHPTIVQLQRQEQAARSVLQRRVADVLGNRAQITPGQLQIGTTKQTLVADLAKAEVERMGLAQRLDALGRSQAAYANRASSLPALEKTQRELQRQLDAAQTTYKTLLTKLQEVQIAANQQVGNAEVVSMAEVPTDPISPRMMLILLAGGGVGVLLGIAAAFLLDYGDRSIHTMREARDLFQYPLLGVIPAVETGGFGADPAIPRLITREQTHFAAQEAYQMLQANLRFLTSEVLTSMVITSAVGKEGKSTVAANLATAIAQVNRRVLLVDANLRTPCQHHVWNLVNRVGLSNVIVNQVSFADAVQVVSRDLHVLTAGVIPPNPVTLLDSRQMADLIEQFTQTYDVVIFDAPSLSGTADATVLNQLTDGTLLVVRPGMIDQSTAKAAKEYLKQSGQKVLGMVVNHIDPRKEPDSYFYNNQKELARFPMARERTEV